MTEKNPDTYYKSVQRCRRCEGSRQVEEMSTRYAL